MYTGMQPSPCPPNWPLCLFVVSHVGSLKNTIARPHPSDQHYQTLFGGRTLTNVILLCLQNTPDEDDFNVNWC